ncbi:MAG: HAMP domain-containing protein, partial [Chloroflexi bacterium]|nr:HAMP domain-containing protein [Chloroflexota bacterium]
MRSLTLKLVLAFLVVSLAGTALVALFVWQTTTMAFDRYVLDQMRDDFVTQATAYYEAQGSWTGVMEHFQRVPQPAPQQLPRPGGVGQPTPQPQQPPPLPGGVGQPALQPQAVQAENAFALTAGDGRVVVPAGPYRIGDRVPDGELARGEPVEVDGQVVGTVLTVTPPPQRTPRDQAYLAYTSQALLVAALVATGVALVLGILLARTLTRPVRELTAATRSLAQGSLTEPVPVRSRD